HASIPAAAGPGSARKPLKKYGCSSGPTSVTPPLVPSSTSLPPASRRTADGIRYRYANSVPATTSLYSAPPTAATARRQPNAPQMGRNQSPVATPPVPAHFSEIAQERDGVLV